MEMACWRRHRGSPSVARTRPGTAVLTEVFRQADADKLEISTWLGDGEGGKCSYRVGR